MNIFRLINEKVIAVFLVSMLTVIAFSTYLSNVDKEDLQKAVASVSMIKENKEEEKEEVLDLIEDKVKLGGLTIRKKTYDEMTFAEKQEALYAGTLEMKYSELYTYLSSRLSKNKGAIYFNGHKETYYSQRVLPGVGLRIPGRHVANDGTVRDADGYICVAANPSFMSKGTILITSLGPAKVYDTGCSHGIIDIYVNW